MMAALEWWVKVMPSLARVSLEGALLALLVGGVCRLRPSLPAGVRAGLWWAVSLKLLVGLLPLPAIAVPLLPAEAPASVGERVAPLSVQAPVPREAGVGQSGAAFEGRPSAEGLDAAASRASVDGAASRASVDRAAIGVASGGGGLGARATWVRVLAALWLGGVGLQGALLAWHLARWRGLLRRAAPAPAALQALAATIASQIGLSRCPSLRVSAEVDVPQVGGGLRPVVLLPAGATARLSGEELAMVVCHELAHVRRRDLLLGWVPALAERAFFFHPAAWLAAREYALAREAACDHIVLDALDAPPGDYGRLLLRLGVGAKPTRLVAAGASPTRRLLMRRLQMLEHAPPPSRFLPPLLLGLVTAVACAPVDLARRAPPARSAASVSAAPPAPASEVGEAAEASEPGEESRPEEEAAEGEAERPATSPGPAPRHRRDEERAEVRRDAWVFLDARSGRDESVVIMSGTTRDAEAARRARGSKTAPLLYARRGDKAYVITDPATLDAARKLIEPLRELGRRQGDLGTRQGELGAEQGKLGARQGEFGAKHAALASKFAAREMARAAADMRREAMHEREDGTGDERRRERERAAERERERVAERAHDREQRVEHERAIRELDNKQREIGREQAHLGEQQAALGREQARLGERQREAGARAESELRSLVEKAITSGTASPAR